MDKSWIDLAVEREAIPKPLRNETVEEFCALHEIGTTTYWYQMRKEDNLKRILEITLNKAKGEAPEVLNVLVEKAKKGDMKAMDIYVDSILKLAKNLDLKTDGKPIIYIDPVVANKLNLNATSRQPEGDSE